MKKTRTKRRSVILRFALLVFSVYVLFSIGSLRMQLSESKKELNRLNQLKTEKTQKINELVDLLENGTEADFIEKAARERLGYVFSDEKVYIDLSGN
ncbi:MAG: septum formation initiator family protein [Clostridia bacterium]|nr:septum formation initiator family protein [Clostridia bacterium]MBQ7289200.1 septum formation initiator family protein [Clostridia bacterium]